MFSQRHDNRECVNELAEDLTMTVLTERDKRLIAEEIRRIDAWIDDALKKLGEEDWAGAKESVREAIKRKNQKLVPKFPGVDVDGEGFELPFYGIYDLLRSIDQAAVSAQNIASALGASAGGVTPRDLRAIRGRLRVLLQELIFNMIKLPWFDEESIDYLEHLREKIEQIIVALEGLEQTGKIDYSVFDGVENLKRRFLEWVSDSIDLWAVYTLLDSMDTHLYWALSGIAKYAPLRGFRLKRAKQRLELAARLKHKLGALVRGTPAGHVEEPGEEDITPDRGNPPDHPEWEPGMEDLPPFPPPDHA